MSVSYDVSTRIVPVRFSGNKSQYVQFLCVSLWKIEIAAKTIDDPIIVDHIIQNEANIHLKFPIPWKVAVLNNKSKTWKV